MDHLLLNMNEHAAAIVNSLIISVGASSTFAMASIVSTSFGRWYRSCCNNSASDSEGNYRAPNMISSEVELEKSNTNHDGHKKSN